MTFQQALDDFKLYLKIECGLTENSILNYEFDIKKLMAYLKEFEVNATPEDIDEDSLKLLFMPCLKSSTPEVKRD